MAEKAVVLPFRSSACLKSLWILMLKVTLSRISDVLTSPSKMPQEEQKSPATKTPVRQKPTSPSPSMCYAPKKPNPQQSRVKFTTKGKTLFPKEES